MSSFKLNYKFWDFINYARGIKTTATPATATANAADVVAATVNSIGNRISIESEL